MAEKEKNFEVVKKYYFRKEGIVEDKGYDWIGKACFELYPVELDGKLGFANCNGEIVVPIIYDRQCHVNDTVWAGNKQYLDLSKNGLYGLIKHDGTEVVAFQWESMELNKLSEDLLPVSVKERWGFVNVKTGKTQVEPIYDEVKFFKNGFASVRIKDKWGMIDINGNVIIQPKYLLESHFEEDFAIMYEGGFYRYARNSGISIRLIYDSNCKIVNKKGYEIVTDCSWIEKTGINTFTLTRKVNNKSVDTVRQFIPFSDYIIIIDDGEYRKGYITPEGEYSEEFVVGTFPTFFQNAKYLGGGIWSAIDYTGKTITIPSSELQKVKENLIANN